MCFDFDLILIHEVHDIHEIVNLVNPGPYCLTAGRKAEKLKSRKGLAVFLALPFFCIYS
jgi:hypothetical protein